MIPFKQILIPVDSLIQAQTSLEKALELYDPAETSIHIVTIIRFDTFWQRILNAGHISIKPNRFKKKQALAKKKLDILKAKALTLAPDCVIKTAILSASAITDTLAKYVHQHSIDLAILTKRTEQKHWFSIGKKPMSDLAKRANIPVLTVTPGCLKHAIKSILLPVRSHVPDRKIQMALAFARKYHAHIHLVTMIDTNQTNSKIRVDAFYLTYKILTEYGHSPQYKILQGEDTDASLIRYADQIKADMILVNPEKKKRFPILVQHKLTDLLSPVSGLHVLTLKPFIKSTQ